MFSHILVSFVRKNLNRLWITYLSRLFFVLTSMLVTLENIRAQQTHTVKNDQK